MCCQFRTLLVVSAIIAIAFAGIAFTLQTIDSVLSHTRDAYAADWTAEFVVQHLQSSDNTWPSNWSDLEDEFAAQQQQGYPFTFEELKRLVDIQWDTDAVTIANSDPPMKVVQLASGSDSHFVGSEPNLRIRDYLRKALTSDEEVSAGE